MEETRKPEYHLHLIVPDKGCMHWPLTCNASVKEDGTTIRYQLLKVLCCLMDIYEEETE